MTTDRRARLMRGLAATGLVGATLLGASAYVAAERPAADAMLAQDTLGQLLIVLRGPNGDGIDVSMPFGEFDRIHQSASLFWGLYVETDSAGRMPNETAGIQLAYQELRIARDLWSLYERGLESPEAALLSADLAQLREAGVVVKTAPGGATVIVNTDNAATQALLDHSLATAEEAYRSSRARLDPQPLEQAADSR